MNPTSFPPTTPVTTTIVTVNKPSLDSLLEIEGHRTLGVDLESALENCVREDTLFLEATKPITIQSKIVIETIVNFCKSNPHIKNLILRI